MKITHGVNEDGTVYCAVKQNVVDVMACYACSKMVEIDLDTRRPKVICAVNSDLPQVGVRRPQPS